VPQLSERCLSRKAGIVRCCPKLFYARKCRSMFSYLCFASGTIFLTG
jgi:hypothetical protein